MCGLENHCPFGILKIIFWPNGLWFLARIPDVITRGSPGRGDEVLVAASSPGDVVAWLARDPMSPSRPMPES
jgi:hypothetical protein